MNPVKTVINIDQSNIDNYIIKRIVCIYYTEICLTNYERHGFFHYWED
jgi:hypothetical protein